MSAPKKKAAVSGSIDPRWPKPRVVRWLEVGAVPAIVGLWLPDWLGAYAGGTPLSLGLPAFPPLVTYVGAVVLIVACYQGIKDMGSHFRGVQVSGALAIAAAAGSVVLSLLGAQVASLVATGFAAVFATGALWFTIGKVAEITQETRARATWFAIPPLTAVAAATYLYGVSLHAAGASSAITVMRLGLAVLTIVFGVCRYGVHVYKTQTSIGAAFVAAPDEQFWVGAE